MTNVVVAPHLVKWKTHPKGLAVSLLPAFGEDHVGLWFVHAEVKDALVDASPSVAREATLAILHDMLDGKLIVAGFPAHGGMAFEPWDLSPDDVIRRIRFEWRALGRDPSIAEIVWFTTPTTAARNGA